MHKHGVLMFGVSRGTGFTSGRPSPSVILCQDKDPQAFDTLLHHPSPLTSPSSSCQTDGPSAPTQLCLSALRKLRFLYCISQNHNGSLEVFPPRELQSCETHEMTLWGRAFSVLWFIRLAFVLFRNSSVHMYRAILNRNVLRCVSITVFCKIKVIFSNLEQSTTLLLYWRVFCMSLHRLFRRKSGPVRGRWTSKHCFIRYFNQI